MGGIGSGEGGDTIDKFVFLFFVLFYFVFCFVSGMFCFILVLFRFFFFFPHAKPLPEHALTTTEPARQWLEEFDRRLPNDYNRFPGKMDHATCVCFRAGAKSVGDLRGVSTLPPFG